MEDPRIGVYICWCGTNIAKMVDVESVAESMKDIENVVVSKNYKYMCSDPGQELIINDIREHSLNRVVVAACSPRIHELTFRKALENAGLNPYLFQMANIREQVSWVHSNRDIATEKAKSLVRAAITRVIHHEALERRRVDIHPATLVIGGGISGITAALTIANSGKEALIIEKSDHLGGIAAELDLMFPSMNSAKQMIRPKVYQAINHPNIEVFLNSTVEEIFGYIGNFKATVRQNGELGKEIEFGNIILATGLRQFDPSMMNNYGYGKYHNVITSLEFEKKISTGGLNLPLNNGSPGRVAIIHCVGSRNEDYKPYCSRTCCTTALKYANQVRAAFPDADIFEIYADMRTFGKGCEEFYNRTARNGTVFMMYDQRGELPRILPGSNGGVMISFNERLSGEDVIVPAELVILMTAMESHEDARETARKTGVSLCGNEFFIEKHPKLDPVATTTGGVYIAGSCQGPKDITDSVAQAKAAAARILATIAQGSVEVEVITAHVNDAICCGCQTCISVCPYSAIEFDQENNVSLVNEILCKGCGTCGSACPTGAIRSRHFTDQQILSQIEGLLAENLTKKQIVS